MIFVVVRFSSPRQALIFAGLILVGGAIAIGYPMCESARRHEAYEHEREVAAKVGELATRAVHAAADAKRACFAAVDRALNRALPKVIDAPALEPSDAAALRGAPFVHVKHAVSVQMPAPEGPYYGGGACDFEPSKRVRDAASQLTGNWSPETFEAAAADARALLASIDKAGPARAVVGVTDYKCGRKNGDPCTGVVAWFSTVSNKPLAVIRVTRPMEALGWEKDAAALTQLAFPVMARWPK